MGQRSSFAQRLLMLAAQGDITVGNLAHRMARGRGGSIESERVMRIGGYTVERCSPSGCWLGERIPALLCYIGFVYLSPSKALQSIVEGLLVLGKHLQRGEGLVGEGARHGSDCVRWWEFKIPQSNFPTQTPIADEAAFTGVDVVHGGAATTISSIDA
ncbi:hypothetical protein Tco_1266377 [Tanacetum coccineum]